MTTPWHAHPQLLPALLQLYQNGSWRDPDALFAIFKQISPNARNIDVAAISSQQFHCPDDHFRMTGTFAHDHLNIQFATTLLDFMLASPPYSLCPTTGAGMSHPLPIPENEIEMAACDALTRAGFDQALTTIKAEIGEPLYLGMANESPFKDTCYYQPKEYLGYWLHSDGKSQLHLSLSELGHGDKRCNVEITFNYYDEALLKQLDV